MKNLQLNNLYSRKNIHSIFSPQTKFTPQAGTWGLHGIIKIPNRERDFVFIVTYGQSQGEHNFDEGITADGVLSWQSQPSQDLSNKIIIQIINHDDITDNIFLFLREDKKSDYKYLGKLAYLDHDTQREMPVYFQWQLLDWDEMNNGITSEETSIDFMQPKEPKPKKLEMVEIMRHPPNKYYLEEILEEMADREDSFLQQSKDKIASKKKRRKGSVNDDADANAFGRD